MAVAKKKAKAKKKPKTKKLKAKTKTKTKTKAKAKAKVKPKKAKPAGARPARAAKTPTRKPSNTPPASPAGSLPAASKPVAVDAHLPSGFQVEGTNDAALFTLKLHRGEGMTLIAMNWKSNTQPPEDFVGFAIEYREPGGTQFFPLKNRLGFLDAQGNVDPK